MNVKGILAVSAGVFTIVAAFADWNWFMQNYKARFFVNLLGRQGARVFYAVLGLVIIVLGLRLG